MAETKNKVVTVESLSALHTYNKSTYMPVNNGVLSTIITIPSGRMLGDVNGDGKLNTKDVELIAQYVIGWDLDEDEFNVEYADVDKNGAITIDDYVSALPNIINGKSNSEIVLGKEYWTLNSNYGNSDYITKEMRVYTDIPINGMVTGDFAIITIVNENYDKDFFYVESFDGNLRLYAKIPPISEVVAIVQYGRNIKNNANTTAINSLCNGASRLENLFADGETILSSYQYGDKLPDAGIKGRIFFKRLTDI